MTNYQLVTCNASSPKESYYCEKEFHASLARYGVTPIILGQPPYSWHWGGLGSKAKWLKRAIDEKVITADIVIFTDCHDLVYAGHPQAVADKFLTMGKPIIFGAERHCFTGKNDEAEMAALHPPTPYSFKYLNSGWHIAKADAMKAVLDEMNPDAILDDHKVGDEWILDNDQSRYMKAMLLGKLGRELIGLDNKCELVQNFFLVTKEEIALEDGGKIRNLETGSYPLVAHWNGPSKDYGLMKPILKHLGLQ